MEERTDSNRADTLRSNSFSLHELLCRETLHSSLHNSTNVSVDSREGLKALLEPSLNPLPQIKSESTEKPIFENPRWENCLKILVEDFCAKKGELLKLNKARRIQIEIAIQKYCGANCGVTLEQLHNAKVGSREHDVLLHFANETAIFQLLQILLLKRWMDQGILPPDSLHNNEQTLNWKITSFLKKHHPKRILQKNEWRFLKQNIYSWHSPSKEAWERIRLHLLLLNLGNAEEDFLVRVLLSSIGTNRMETLGISRQMPLTEFAWKLLLKFLFVNDKSTRSMEPIFVAGLAHGQSLVAYERSSPRHDLQRVIGFTENDFEHFITEILLLWANPRSISHPQLMPLALLKKAPPSEEQSFLQERNSLLQQPVSLGFFHLHRSNSNAYEQALQCVDLLAEHGLILLNLPEFWTTEDSPEAAAFRESVLKKCSIRCILDLRQCSLNTRNSESGPLPKGFYVLEKCSTREWRDSNRPLVFKIKGTLASTDAMLEIWESLEKRLEEPVLPGEIFTANCSPSSGSNFRLEAMAAATTQQQLKSAPWNTLTETCYYEISSELKRIPLRVYGCGNILRAKNIGPPEITPTFKRSVALQEIPGKALTTQNLQEKSTQFLFVPDRSVAESSTYFSAMINSSPIQFWYRLEHEQDEKKRGRSQERQTEQLLKFMPVARIFSESALIPVSDKGSRVGFASIADARAKADRLLSRRSRGNFNDQTELHDLIVDLENTISRHTITVLDFVKHLFPELTIERWCLPTSLPEISAFHALGLLKHLDQLPLAHHSAIQIVHLRTIHDFRLSQAKINTVYGPISEMLLYSGNDPVLRLQGPSLFIRYLHTDLQKKIGRSWLETAQKTYLPADAALVNAQIEEFLKITTGEIQSARHAIDCQNAIFSVLFGVASSLSDDTRLATIRRHLYPGENKIILPLQRLEKAAPKLGDSAAPKVILQ